MSISGDSPVADRTATSSPFSLLEYDEKEPEPWTKIATAEHGNVESQSAGVQLESVQETNEILVSIVPPSHPQGCPWKPTPCDLIICLQLSVSMNERATTGSKFEPEQYLSKLELAKQAAKIAINSMHDDDRLAIVTFGPSASVVQPLERMTKIGRRRASFIIDGLGVDPGCGFAAAIREAHRLLQDSEGNRIRAIHFFSDGIIGKNEPMCARAMAPIVEMIQERRNEVPIMSIFGFGHDCNINVLCPMAEAANGIFSVITHENAARSVMAATMANLFTIFATSTKVELQWSDPEMEIEFPDFLSAQFPTETSAIVDIGVLLYYSRRTILLKCKKPLKGTVTAILEYITPVEREKMTISDLSSDSAGPKLENGPWATQHRFRTTFCNLLWNSSTRSPKIKWPDELCKARDLHRDITELIEEIERSSFGVHPVGCSCKITNCGRPMTLNITGLRRDLELLSHLPNLHLFKAAEHIHHLPIVISLLQPHIYQMSNSLIVPGGLRCALGSGSMWESEVNRVFESLPSSTKSMQLTNKTKLHHLDDRQDRGTREWCSDGKVIGSTIQQAQTPSLDEYT